MQNKNLIQLKKFSRSFFPENKQELIILFFFTIFYSLFSIPLATNTSIIDYKDMLYDVYFSFDNPIIYRQGYVYLEGHPLMMFITMPFIHIGNVLAGILSYKAKTVFLSFLCTLLISFSTIYVYRYLRTIIEITGYLSYLLVILFGFTATNLILCFTPESFTITTFFLSFTIWFYSDRIKKNETVGVTTGSFLAIVLGGLTITNFAKGIIPMLFLKDSRKEIIKKIIIAGAIFSILIIWMQIQYDFIGLIKFRLVNNISVPARGNYFEKVFEWLYAGPVFFPEIILLPIKVDGVPFDSISLEFYHYWWQYCFAVVLLAILIYSIYKNYKNKLVLMMVLLLLEDIVIHGIIRYGIRDAFIYGGHWVFLVPLIIGWGIKSLLENNEVKETSTVKNSKKYISIFLTTLVIIMIINNGVRLYDFLTIAYSNFPPYTL